MREQASVTIANLPRNEIADLCQMYHVRELSVFGSVARGEAREDSDVDFLVEFDAQAGVGFFAFTELQEKLSEVLSHPVDLVSKRGLKDIIRNQILSEAEVIFAA